MRAREKYVRTAVKALLLIVLAVCCCFFNREVTQMLAFLTVQSVKTYLPSKGISLNTVPDTQATQVTSAQAVSKADSQAAITVKPMNSESKKDTLTVTDDDIAKAVKQAEKNAAKDKKDGDIIEYTFTDDGVTDEFENVRVKNTNRTEIDIEKKLGERLPLTVSRDKPAVLIYHTHTTETYQMLDRDFYAQGYLSRSNDKALNMIRVGKAIAEEIEKQGFKVIHDTNVYDNPYTGAYYRSEDAVKKLLEKNPSVIITLDVHRDAIQNDSGEKTKPTALINGKKAAQIMLISGCQEEGNGITDLPDWEKNLTFALKLQQSMESLYPGLTRPVFFCARSYNMGLTPCSLLVEMGSDANTLDEAVYSGKMLGRALCGILEEYEVKKDGA